MKRYISTLALCALAFIGLNSCNKTQEVDLENGTRTVTFQVQMGPDTRTGLSVKFVPDWTDTKIANVHLFEDHKGNHMEGKNVKMEIDENNDEIAYFSADYTDEWTIIVDPTMPETRASATDYVYTGVVAQRTGEGDNAKYVVPDVQNPGKNTLIDPDADFLVGRAPEAYTSGQSLKQVDMIFKRPVSVSRLAIWGIPEGEKVQEVKIVSADKLTGSVALSGIDFENRTVEAFDETSGSTTITLNYGAGEAVPAEAFFNAYFISLPGAKKILSIEVTTDQKTYIKEFDGGKTLTFKTPDFKSIAVNMLDTATDDGKQERDLHFVKGQTTVTTDAYDIWDATNQTYADAYVAPTLAGTTEGATPVWNSSDQDVATVDAEGNVTIVGAGTTEITVLIASSDTYKSGNASFTLTVSDSTPAPQDQPLKFVKGGATITEDNTDIYPEVSYTTPTLEGAVSGATVSFEISCTPVGCATIAPDGTVTPVAAGVAVITAKATAVEPLWNETTKSYTLTITDSTPAAGTTYYLVAKPEDVVAGKYLIVSAADAYIFDGTGTYQGGYTTIADAEDITLDSDKKTITINGETDAFDFTFAKSGNGFTITGEKGMIVADEHSGASTSTETYITFAETGGSVFLQRGSLENKPEALLFSTTRGTSSNEYLYYNTTNKIFKIGGSGSSNGIHLYFAGERAAQTVGFGEEEFTYDLAGEGSWSPSVPAVSGTYYTELVYASSNEEVIKYDKDNGWVFGTAAEKNATATVTVTAPASDQYLSATASFTVTIVDTTPGGDEPSSAYYQRVTASSEFVQDGVYVIVNESNSKLFKPVLNSTNSNFQTTNNTIDVTIADGKIASSSAVDACQIVLKNADGNGKFALFVPSVNYYLQVYNGSNFKADASDDGFRSTFSVTSAGVASIYRDNTHYIRYSGTNSAFQVGNNSDNIAVYKYVSEGGTTPEPPTPSANPTYTLIEGSANLVTGTYVIADKTDAYLFNASGTNNGGYSTIGTTTGVTRSGSTITLASDVAGAHEFEITRTGITLTIKQVGGTHAGQYMFATASTTDTYIGFQSTAKNFTLNPQENTDYVFFYTDKSTDSPTEYLYKKSSDSYFKLGKSGTPSDSNGGLLLYKRN